ncbi:hypothetical protein ACFXTH_032092 [Malus domestica]
MEPLAQQFTGLRVKMIITLHLEALEALNPTEAKQNAGFAPHRLRRDLGDVTINWVKHYTFIIIVKDEETTSRILNQVPWVVVKQNFSVKRWPSYLAVDEVLAQMVPFWVQMKGVPLFLSMEENAKRLAGEVGDFIVMEDLAKARGFLQNLTLNAYKTSAINVGESVTRTWNAPLSKAGEVSIERRHLGMARPMQRTNAQRKGNHSCEERPGQSTLVPSRFSNLHQMHGQVQSTRYAPHISTDENSRFTSQNGAYHMPVGEITPHGLKQIIEGSGVSDPLPQQSSTFTTEAQSTQDTAGKKQIEKLDEGLGLKRIGNQTNGMGGQQKPFDEKDLHEVLVRHDEAMAVAVAAGLGQQQNHHDIPPI